MATAKTTKAVTKPAKSKLFSGMRKKLTKKYDDIILDLEEPHIWATAGNFVLNHILSGQFSRGYPSGRITQLFGESGSGKSFLVSAAIAKAQQDGYMVIIIDSEQAMSQDYLSKIGVDTDPSMLMTVQAYTVEDTQDIIVDVLTDIKAEQKELGNTTDLKLMLVVDSLGLLSSGKAAKDAESGNQAADMGTKAKALVRMFNAVTQKIGVTETVCIMTNHGATEVGVMFPQMKPTGGRSVEFVPSISLRITKGKIKATDLEELSFLYGGTIPKHLSALGIVARIDLYKSRFTRPFRKVKLMIPYDTGLHEYAALFTYLYENEVITAPNRKGYYNYSLAPLEKDFTRKAFIDGGYAKIIMDDLLKRESEGEIFDFVMKSPEDIEREKLENKDADDGISEEINDSIA